MEALSAVPIRRHPSGQPEPRSGRSALAARLEPAARVRSMRVVPRPAARRSRRERMADLDHREAGSAALETPTLPEVGIRSSRRFSFQAASSDPLARGRSLPLLTVVMREVSIPRFSR